MGHNTMNIVHSFDPFNNRSASKWRSSLNNLFELGKEIVDNSNLFGGFGPLPKIGRPLYEATALVNFRKVQL